jgi:hypothetical protein
MADFFLARCLVFILILFDHENVLKEMEGKGQKTCKGKGKDAYRPFQPALSTGAYTYCKYVSEFGPLDSTTPTAMGLVST